MRADRLLTLLMMLQVRGHTSAEALAEALDVSVRTVYRDIAALERSGIPVMAERGRDGGFRLVEGYGSRLTGLSMTEAEALPFTHVLAAASALGLRAEAQAARAKTIAALPHPVREHAMRAANRFHFDPVDWYARPAAPPLLKSIANALWSDQAIAIDYESWQSRRVCVVEPLGIVCKAANWYLVGRRRKRIGIFRIESVHSVRVVAGRKVARGRFHLESVWQQEVTRFEAGLRRYLACIRVSRAAMSRISVLGADAAEVIRNAAPDEAGWRTAEIWIESISHAATQLLGFADDIEVISPKELRQDLAARAGRVSAIYNAERQLHSRLRESED